MKNNTPAIYATGAYTVSTPFSVSNGAVYTCESITGFDALVEEGVDIYATYYVPNGIDVTRFNADIAGGVSIVTLMSDSTNSVVLPSSFITSFPVAQAVTYRRTIVSVDIGMLPENVNLQLLMTELEIAAKDFSGVTPSIKQHVSSITSPVSYTNHASMEAARRALIRYDKSTGIRLKEALALLAVKTQHIELLEENIINNQ